MDTIVIDKIGGRFAHTARKETQGYKMLFSVILAINGIQ